MNTMISNTDIICPNCRLGHMICEETRVIKSNTQTFNYSCPVCGFVHTAESDDDMKEWIKSLDKKVKKTTNYHAKQDSGKAKLSLVPTRILWDIAAIREYGNNKYPEGGPNNWTRVEKQRYKDAMCRHLLGYLEDAHGIDEESGFPHLWHLACNVAFLCEMEDMHLSKDKTVKGRLRTKFKNTPNAAPEPVNFKWDNIVEDK